MLSFCKAIAAVNLSGKAVFAESHGILNNCFTANLVDVPTFRGVTVPAVCYDREKRQTSTRWHKYTTEKQGAPVIGGVYYSSSYIYAKKMSTGRLTVHAALVQYPTSQIKQSDVNISKSSVQNFLQNFVYKWQ